MSRCIQMDPFLSAVLSQGASQLELMEQAPKKVAIKYSKVSNHQ